MPSYIVLTAIMSLFVPQIGAESVSLHSKGTTFTLVVERQMPLDPDSFHYNDDRCAKQSRLKATCRYQTLRHNEVTF